MDQDIDTFPGDTLQKRKTDLQKLVSKSLVQRAHGHTPRLLDSRSPSRHGKIGKMPHSFELFGLHDQDLTAPNLPISAVACAVQSNTYHRPRKAMFCHGAHYVGMVMLDPNLNHGRLLQGILCAQVIRMEIIGNNLGLDFQYPFQVLDSHLKKIEGLQVFQIAYVLTQECLVSPGETDGIFPFSAAGKNGLQRPLKKSRYGHITSAAPDLPWHGANHTEYGIVASKINVTIVIQEVISNISQALKRLLVINGNGLLADVPAGHDQGRKVVTLKQEVMKGRIG